MNNGLLISQTANAIKVSQQFEFTSHNKCRKHNETDGRQITVIDNFKYEQIEEVSHNILRHVLSVSSAHVRTL